MERLAQDLEDSLILWHYIECLEEQRKNDLKTMNLALKVSNERGQQIKELKEIVKEVCKCKDEWLVDVRLNVMKCEKCGTEF